MLGSVLSISLRILAAGTTFVVNLVIARLLGADSAGVFFLALTVVTVFATCSRIGLDGAMVRIISELTQIGDKVSISHVYRFAMSLVSCVSLAVTFVLLLGAEWISTEVFKKPTLAPVLKIMSLAVFPTAIFMLHSFFFQGARDIPRYLVFQHLAVSLLFLSFVTILWVTEPSFFSTESLAATHLLATILTLVAAYVSWRIAAFGKNGYGTYDYKRILRISWPLFFVALMGIVNNWMGQLTLGLWKTSEDVAIFNAASRTAMLMLLALMAVNSVAFPQFAALHNQGDHRGIRFIAIWSTRVLVAGCLPLLIVMLAFSADIMRLFGPEFVPGSIALMVLALGQFVNAGTGSVGGLLTMTGHERFALMAGAIGATSMCLLCLWLVPRHGVVGAAIAQTVSLCTQLLVATIAVKKLFGFMPVNIFSKT